MNVEKTAPSPAQPIPPDRPPTRLYKYRSVDEKSRPFTERIFRRNEVWYARASSFNDPFDCNHHIEADLNEQQWRDVFRKFEQQLGSAVFGVVGGFLGHLFGKIVNPLIEKGKLSEKLRVTAEAGEALGRRLGAQSQLSFGGKPVREIPSGTRAGRDGVQRPAPEVLNELYGAFVEQARSDVDQRFGVLSLSEVRDSILMWSHYADQHRGICIEFDLTASPTVFPQLEPVAYQDTSPIITQRFANALINLKDSLRPQQFAEVFLSELGKRDLSQSWSDQEVRAWFLTKAAFWLYEREWRSLKRESGILKVPAAAISAVIVGCVDSERTLELVRPWIRNRRRKVALYRAVKRKGAFSLDVVPLA